jgi:succinate dehydrogenase / fumarate reductase flavoprotein subunit
MSESLRNDGRVWVPKERGDNRDPREIPESERDYYLERIYPAFGNLVPRDIASRQAKNVCDEGRGVGPGGLGVYLDFGDAMERLGRPAIEAKYGNLFDMYAQITGEDPYETPMRIYPAVHYTMGGLWVDYDLQSTIPGMFVIGEANFSDHGANRLGASALMQGLADGYFVLPNTINDYLADGPFEKVDDSHPAVVEALQAVQGRVQKLLSINGSRTPGLVPPRARPADVGPLRHGALGGGPAQGPGPDPRDPPGVLDQPQGLRRPGHDQPDAGARRPASPTSSTSPS